jgi:hypothetical protein
VTLRPILLRGGGGAGLLVLMEATRALLTVLVGLLLIVGVAVAADAVNGDDPGNGDIVSVVG